MNQKWSMLKLGWQEEWEFLWRSLRIDHFWWRLRIKWFSAWSNYGGKRGRGRGAQHSMRKNSNQNLSDMIHDLLKTPNKKHFSHNILLSYWLFCPPYPASSKSHLSPPSSCSTTYSPFCEYLESLEMTSYRDSYRLLKRARLSEFRGFAVKVILSEALVRSKRRFLSGQSGGSCQVKAEVLVRETEWPIEATCRRLKICERGRGAQHSMRNSNQVKSAWYMICWRHLIGLEGILVASPTKPWSMSHVLTIK